MLMLNVLIGSLLISMSKSHYSCGILSKLESLFSDQIDLIPSLKKCLGNLNEFQQGISTKKTSTVIVNYQYLTVKYFIGTIIFIFASFFKALSMNKPCWFWILLKESICCCSTSIA